MPNKEESLWQENEDAYMLALLYVITHIYKLLNHLNDF